MVNTHNIVWTKRAQLHIREVFDYISLDSPNSAIRVIEDITIAIRNAVEQPKIYAADRFKLNNDGSYRSFEKHNYRIVYRVEKNVIRILLIRHTSRMPHQY